MRNAWARRLLLRVFLVLTATLALGCGPGAGSGRKLKTLLWIGGPIHNHRAVGRIVERHLQDYGRFDVSRIENDLNAFLAENLESFDVVVFYNTLGEITDAQKKGIMDFVSNGKGLVTFHSGADSFRGDKDWHDFVGGHFVTHPSYRKYPVKVVDKRHPIMKGFGDFSITDEQYMLEYEKEAIRVLATGPGMKPGDPPMPAVWVRSWGDGRVFYMGFGHDERACADPEFRRLLCRATLWAAGERSLGPGR